jgi:16S rRNA (uracil1498-N3)-methyltransferase
VNRVYCRDVPGVGECVTLSGEESRHLLRVRRAKRGDDVVLFDGRGTEAAGRIAEVAGRDAVVEVLVIETAPPDAATTAALVTAIPKGTRMADLVRACTEIGVARIHPVVAERSAVRPKLGSSSERWDRIAREASKQSKRSHFPEVLPVADLDGGLAQVEGCALKLIADTCADAVPLREALAGRAGCGSVALAIGPEGGFTDEERTRAADRGFIVVRQEGPIMRVETAAAALLAICLYECS